MYALSATNFIDQTRNFASRIAPATTIVGAPRHAIDDDLKWRADGWQHWRNPQLTQELAQFVCVPGVDAVEQTSGTNHSSGALSIRPNSA
ncbi:hypothetical protein Rcas_1906 [Roseiflexus castenholzii DSM 13941]|uniref:Uncharacterized protein n=1 Tax=Roseiflexus castenholzii (strain DSM 13941 / HLO8) TaxID=383372 RepID=A7NKH6_ROSCS|nr:hypothetical protein Rcas_1906 [Roseiflexus castenholzii DSM 13941]